MIISLQMVLLFPEMEMTELVRVVEGNDENGRMLVSGFYLQERRPN